MKTGQILLLTLAVAAAGLAAWLFLGSGWPRGDAGNASGGVIVEAPQWRIDAGTPLLVGDLKDPFAYAGGDATRLLEGSARLGFDPEVASGNLRASIALDGSVAVLADSIDPSSMLELDGELTARNIAAIDQMIHGETGLGDPNLPEARAILAGTADLAISIDGTPRGVTYRGAWSVAEALRRGDGAIRNQGLIYSPLLRDNTVFADASRLELTLLVYRSGPAAQSDSVILHVVYGDVQVLAAPEDIEIPPNPATPEG